MMALARASVRAALSRRSPTSLRARRAVAPRAQSAAAAPAEAAPKEIFRADYTPYPYALSTVSLAFDLREGATTVTSTMSFSSPAGGAPLELDGDASVAVVSVRVSGAELSAGAGYSLSEDAKLLTVASPPAGDFELEVTTRIVPEENTQLEGLYKSSGNYCTQCEAQGFRRITYFPDRPDVMATYVTRVEADEASYPVLLGNGDLQESGPCAEAGRHYAVWVDPWKKPCYLFALVAGDLASIEDSFTTASGRDVTLRIYTEAHNIHKCDYAMESLKASMKWDEDVYGLEYDLGLFNIVAVDDFNMGAMENKSLNIFNSRLVLATPETATDGDYERIEGVVGHEYFHNYTGNRVTCRDWFQLSLKEGLTVFRDQQFSADMNDAATKRISDVTRLRAAQFPQDASPMAHPVRPDSYIKMDNFYTVTVYEKGAEVVRMYHTLLGKDGFRKGMDLYFERHDGQAVTCDDFRAAMADSSGEDLSQFELWYSQSGTPAVSASGAWDAAAGTYTLTLAQSSKDTPKQPAAGKKPYLIPLRVGLVGRGSKVDLPLSPFGGATEGVLRLDEAEKTFVFEGLGEEPVLSLNRGFSAPVSLTLEGASDEDLLFLGANDSDSFNRWEALQTVGRRTLLAAYAARAAGGPVTEDQAGLPDLVGAMRAVLADAEGGLDDAFAAAALALPSSSELSEQLSEVDPVALWECRAAAGRHVARALRPELEAVVTSRAPAPGEKYSPDHASKARRALRTTALAYLAKLAGEDPALDALLEECYRSADNMTAQLGALSCASAGGAPCTQGLLESFREKWADDPLVMMKWLGLSAGSDAPGNLPNVRALMEGPHYRLDNPNMNYSLLGGFCGSAVNFHAADGSGYEFLGGMIETLDGVNAQVASRMCSAFVRWRKYDPARQALMKAQLERLLAKEGGLSENTFEVVSKSLEN